MISYFKYTKQAKNKGKGALSKNQNDKEIKRLNRGSVWRLGAEVSSEPLSAVCICPFRDEDCKAWIIRTCFY